MKILRKYTRETIFESNEVNSLKELVELVIKKNISLEGAALGEADLRGADLREADFEKADLSGADLRGADLRGAYLAGANLKCAYLEKADLSRAYLGEANLRGAHLGGVHLGGADLSGQKIRVYNFPEYYCYRINESFTAGCQTHTIAAWKNFTNKEILKMDGKPALKFYREILLKIIDL